MGHWPEKEPAVSSICRGKVWGGGEVLGGVVFVCFNFMEVLFT